MPRKSRGGTLMWCPECEATTACKGVEPKKINEFKKGGRRWMMKAHQDVHWFERGRICQACGYGFITSEVNKIFLDELIELRDALGEIRKHTEEYVSKANDASNSLTSLNKSLDGLRAMKVYKRNGK